jgi:hypothetical protein
MTEVSPIVLGYFPFRGVVLDDSRLGDFKTSVIFYWGSRSYFREGPFTNNPLHGSSSIEDVISHGALSNDLRRLKPEKIFISDSELHSTEMLYLIYSGVAAGLAFGMGKLVGSILSELGKDIYNKIKNSINKEIEANSGDYGGIIVEICIKIDDQDRYICFFNPMRGRFSTSAEQFDKDLDNAYSFLLENADRLPQFDKVAVDLETLRDKLADEKTIKECQEGKDEE